MPNILQNNIAIAIYDKKEEKFEISSYKNYDVKYIRGKKNCLRIIVNDTLTKSYVNLCNPHIGYKGKILQAIHEYETNPDKIIKKYPYFCLEHLKQMANDKGKLNIMNISIKEFLLPIKQEKNRDKLTMYNLVNIYHQ